jgi:DNA invertase Pin-like site-specific DNA recombinase
MAEAAINALEAGAGPSATGLRRYVAYYRMSTRAQSRHGFSLEAQQGAVASYVAANPGKLIAEYAETKSGRNNQRPKIAEALQVCRIFGATLLISRLDRLSRNVAMIARLIESKVEFVAIDFPHATRLTLHLLAAIAEHESRLISNRVKSARAAARARGQPWRSNKPNRPFAPGCQAASVCARHARAQARIKDLAPLVWQAIGEGKSYALIAREFNQRGVRPALHTAWQQNSVGNIARATAKDFAAIAAVRLPSPPGLRRTKMLDRLAQVAPLLLEWKSKGENYNAMARELDRLGYAAPYGRGWGPASIWRYLKLAMEASTSQPPLGATR